MVLVIGLTISALGFTQGHNIIGAITLTAVVTCLSSHTFTALKDPGVEFRKTEIEMTEQEPTERFCIICEQVQASGTEHCSDCDLCIRGYDHHCPWTGKCIGEGNIYSFHIFVGSLLVSLIMIILTTAVCLSSLTRTR
mmetsp:Transcript_7218/g.13264  ORF Transcript_7218/g.13264 Transcript_7218/m.13264 type:complete len:138 (-) Transcript_7218:2076-2489(-)